jgi:YVTN family beta-propeller protein
MTETNGRTTIRQTLGALLCLASMFVGVAGTRADAQTNAFVANSTANAVDVIDTTTNTRVGPPITVGAAPAQVAIAQDGKHVYVTNTGSSPYSISVIDTTDPPTLVATFDIAGRPSSIAVDSRRNRLYVLEAGNLLEVLDATTGIHICFVSVGGSDGQIAITPDGGHVYVAAGNVTVIETEQNSIVAVFTPEETATPGISNVAVGVAISPSEPRAYVAVVSYISDFFGFHVSGGIAVADTTIIDAATAGSTVTPVKTTIPLFSLPGSIAFTADGGRAYVGITSYWADTLYGAGFLPGRWVATIDTATSSVAKWIDLGADGAAWSQQHTPAGLAVTPNRSTVFVSIPSNNTIAVIDPATDTLLPDRTIAAAGGPKGVAVVPDPGASPKPFDLHATDDIAPNAMPAQHAAVAVADVLANDTIGGVRAAIGNVALSVASPTSPSLTLDIATGAVWVAADAAAGTHTLTYQICEPGNAQVCATAAATVLVRERYLITTADDRAMSLPGGAAIANVVANDTLGPDAASLATVTVSSVSSDGALSLNAADGSVIVAAGAARGDHLLTYRICEIADPTNCSANGTVTVTVVWRDIRAANDSASASRAGGVAIANVLGNDLFDGAAATLAGVTISAISSTDAGVTLDPASGAVSVARGTAVGLQTVVYRICERANPANCSDEASASVTVTGFVISAVADRARASSKTATMAVVNVLANDTLGGAPATTANVMLSQVSLSPSNRQIRLNSNGTVDVLGKSNGGTYSLRYQICEIENLTNCAQATVTLDLSGK